MKKNVGRPKGITFSVKKSIKITEEQATNWNPNKVRDFLNGKVSPDCVTYLKFLNDFFKENIEHLLKDFSIDRFIEENSDTFEQIEKVIENT